MKIYIQNGFNKKVMTAPNYSMAAKKFIKSLIITNKDGEEILEISPITLASKCGFLDDLSEMNMVKEIDDMTIIDTSTILASIGRKDIAKFVSKIPKDKFTKSMLNLMK